MFTTVTFGSVISNREKNENANHATIVAWYILLAPYVLVSSGRHVNVFLISAAFPSEANVLKPARIGL